MEAPDAWLPHSAATSRRSSGALSRAPSCCFPSKLLPITPCMQTTVESPPLYGTLHKARSLQSFIPIFQTPCL